MLFLLTWAVFPLLASASLFQQRDIKPAEESLSLLTSKLISLDSNITAFPKIGGSVTQVINIHNQFQDLITATRKAMEDILKCIAIYGIADKIDGVEFISFATDKGGYVEKIADSMKQIVIKKPAFESIPGGFTMLLYRDLVDYNSNSTAYVDSLISGTPVSLVAQAKAIKGQITTAFAKALSTYAPGKPL